jgi:hypothetical protein
VDAPSRSLDANVGRFDFLKPMAPKPETEWYQAYFRMIRRYSLYRSINAGMPRRVSEDFYTRDYADNGKQLGWTLSDPSAFFHDEVLAFFQACYHFKDWIKADPACTHAAPMVEVLITNCPALALAADICNGAKHLVLTKAPRAGAPSTFMGSANIWNGHTQASKFSVDINTTSLDAFDVATACVKEWNLFVRNNLIAVTPEPWRERVIGHAAMWGL